jgi:hypothetical protein
MASVAICSRAQNVHGRRKSEQGISLIGRYYFTRQAMTADQIRPVHQILNLAAVLVEKVAALKSQVDETSAERNFSPIAPMSMNPKLKRDGLRLNRFGIPKSAGF